MTLIDFERRVAALSQFRVQDVSTPVLSTDDRHHLLKVLRAHDGEEVVVTNGVGAWAFAHVADKELTRVSDVLLDPRPTPWTMYVAPLKGDKSELVIAKLTELGVSAIVPLVSERLAIKFKGDARDKVLERWRRIAREATGQCRRTYDVVIGDPVTPHEVSHDVAVAEPGSSGSLHGVSAIAIGPEGGFAPGEWGDEVPRLGLGLTVLRAETAAIAAGTMLASLGEGWVRHPNAGKVGNNGAVHE